jgi:hypothetical protein
VFLRLISHTKWDIAVDAHDIINGATSGGDSSEFFIYKEGLEADTYCFFINFSLIKYYGR